jgi:hypothetical protein
MKRQSLGGGLYSTASDGRWSPKAVAVAVVVKPYAKEVHYLPNTNQLSRDSSSSGQVDILFRGEVDDGFVPLVEKQLEHSEAEYGEVAIDPLTQNRVVVTFLEDE